MRGHIGRESEINWKDLLGNEDSIEDLFNSIGINNYTLVNIRTSYAIDNNRYGIVVTVKKKDCDSLAKVIIDAINGNPTWAQVMDITYNFSDNCEKRIILYDDSMGEKSDYDHDFDEHVSKEFAKINNNCSVHTYIVKVLYSADGMNDQTLEYHLEEGPSINSSPSFDKVHSKEDFDKAEFWIYYDEITSGEPHLIFEPQFWFSDYKKESMNDIDFDFDWNQEGRFLHATINSITGVKKLKWLIENHYYEIHQKIKYWKVSIKKESDIFYRVTMKMSKQPFSDFVYATSDEKRKYIKDIFKNDKYLPNYYDEKIQDMPRE